jgi:hypothetical protein
MIQNMAVVDDAELTGIAVGIDLDLCHHAAIKPAVTKAQWFAVPESEPQRDKSLGGLR